MTPSAEETRLFPQGRYVTAKRYGDFVFTSGMTPRIDGVLISEGRVRADMPVESYRSAVELACSNALAAASGVAGVNERIGQILSLSVFIAAETDFRAHARLADFASDVLHEELGPMGIGARASIGVASLPGNAPVEIQLVATICSEKMEAS